MEHPRAPEMPNDFARESLPRFADCIAGMKTDMQRDLAHLGDETHVLQKFQLHHLVRLLAVRFDCCLKYEGMLSDWRERDLVGEDQQRLLAKVTKDTADLQTTLRRLIDVCMKRLETAPDGPRWPPMDEPLSALPTLLAQIKVDLESEELAFADLQGNCVRISLLEIEDEEEMCRSASDLCAVRASQLDRWAKGSLSLLVRQKLAKARRLNDRMLRVISEERELCKALRLTSLEAFMDTMVAGNHSVM
jgi:hypothetical protein